MAERIWHSRTKKIGRRIAIATLGCAGIWYAGANAYLEGYKDNDYTRASTGIAMGLGLGTGAATILFSDHIKNSTRRIIEGKVLPADTLAPTLERALPQGGQGVELQASQAVFLEEQE